MYITIFIVTQSCDWQNEGNTTADVSSKPTVAITTIFQIIIAIFSNLQIKRQIISLEMNKFNIV